VCRTLPATTMPASPPRYALLLSCAQTQRAKTTAAARMRPSWARALGRGSSRRCRQTHLHPAPGLHPFVALVLLNRRERVHPSPRADPRRPRRRPPALPRPCPKETCQACCHVPGLVLLASSSREHGGLMRACDCRHVRFSDCPRRGGPAGTPSASTRTRVHYPVSLKLKKKVRVATVRSSTLPRYRS